MQPKKGRKPQTVLRARTILQPSDTAQLTDNSSVTDVRFNQANFAVKREFKKSSMVGVGHATKLVVEIMDPDHMRKMAVCDLSDMTGDRSCVEHISMGAREYGETCPTCSCEYGICEGHWGMISLDEGSWFAHPFYVKNGFIASIMNLFCYECFENQLQYFKSEGQTGKTPDAVMLFDKRMVKTLEKQYKQHKRLDRLKTLAEKAKSQTCACKEHTASYFKASTDDPAPVIVQVVKEKGSKETLVEVSIATMYQFLKAITVYMKRENLFKFIDYEEINFEFLIVQVILVLPNRSRPSTPANNERKESDFTALYWAMLGHVREIKEQSRKGDNPRLGELRKDLRDTFYAYINSKAPISIKGRGKVNTGMRTLSGTNDTKRGLFLKHIMSSRVDNSGRTVITADNSIKPNEARIPKWMAEKYIIHLTVNNSNIEACKDLIDKGIAKALITIIQGGRKEKKRITDENRSSLKESLKIGDLILRRLVSGDVVIINRQPTLHRYSISAQKAVVEEDEIPGEERNTVGMNTVYTSGYNADFDGDEIHLHIPKTLEARAQAASLMMVDKIPVSDQTSQNIFGVIQNTPWGAYNMTTKPRNIDKQAWYDMTKTIQDFEGPIGGKKDFDLQTRIKYVESKVPILYTKYGVKGLGVWNTLSLLSLAFPPDFNYSRRGDKEPDIKIVNGILLSGYFKKSIVGAGAGSIVQHMFAEFGPVQISVFSHVLQQVTDAYMKTIARTISIFDFAPDEELEEKMEAVKNEMLRSATEIGQRNVHGIFNQDQLLLYVEKQWLRYDSFPAELKPYVTDQDLGRFRNELVYVLFGVVQVEVNSFKRGKTTETFDPKTISASIRKVINTIFRSSKEILAAGVKAGQLFKLEKLSSRPAQELEKENIMIEQVRQFIFQAINQRTIDFVKEQVGNPFSPDKIDTRSTYEKAKLEADTTDVFDQIKSKGVRLVMDNPGRSGAVVEMVKAGARGNEGNLYQAKFALGSQTMSGERLKEAISGGTRVTPFFLENDPDPSARGYVRNSLFRGMTPADFISAAMPARQTQTDTAFKTGETGYMQKKLMAVCGDYKIYPDGTVRDERANIVTHLYGGHGMDASAMIKKHDNYYFVDVDQLVNQVNAIAESKIRTRQEFFKRI